MLALPVRPVTCLDHEAWQLGGFRAVVRGRVDTGPAWFVSEATRRRQTEELPHDRAWLSGTRSITHAERMRGRLSCPVRAICSDYGQELPDVTQMGSHRPVRDNG